MVNLDNDQELQIVDEMLRGKEEGGSSSSSKFGLRVNPVVGAGENAHTSTATRYSKFGVPITDEEVKRFVFGFIQIR